MYGMMIKRVREVCEVREGNNMDMYAYYVEKRINIS